MIPLSEIRRELDRRRIRAKVVDLIQLGEKLGDKLGAEDKAALRKARRMLAKLGPPPPCDAVD